MVVFPNCPGFTFEEYLPLPYPTYENDVVAVLSSIKTLFSYYFPCIEAHPLTVLCNVPARKFPETIYELNTIFLVVPTLTDKGEPGCYWSNFMYQFSHEFCHYMCFGHVVQRMRWFEESICEMASHFFMIKATDQWSIDPPYPHWSSYANCIASYEIDSKSDVRKFDLKELSNESSPLLKQLEENEYQRDYNKHIALSLLPLFLEDPSLWGIVPLLTKCSADKPFLQNLLLLGQLSKLNVQKILSLFVP